MEEVDCLAEKAEHPMGKTDHPAKKADHPAKKEDHSATKEDVLVGSEPSAPSSCQTL